MAKFIVTVVVETDKAAVPPTKRRLKEWLDSHLNLLDLMSDEVSRQLTKCRVRSIDID